jgi:hypothetical protein
VGPAADHRGVTALDFTCGAEPRQAPEMEFDRPDVVAEVTAAFTAYEEALLENRVDELDAAFWDDERVVRLAFGEAQYGAAEVAAARRRVVRQTPPRRLERLTVRGFGTDAAAVYAEFVLDDGTLVHQSQVWARLEDGWRVATAHVSAHPPSYRSP